MSTNDRTRIATNSQHDLVSAEAVLDAGVASQRDRLTDEAGLAPARDALSAFADRLDALDGMTDIFDAPLAVAAELPDEPFLPSPPEGGTEEDAERYEDDALSIGGIDIDTDDAPFGEVPPADLEADVPSEGSAASSGDAKMASLIPAGGVDEIVFAGPNRAPPDTFDDDWDFSETVFHKIDDETARGNAVASGRAVPLDEIAGLPETTVETFSYDDMHDLDAGRDADAPAVPEGMRDDDWLSGTGIDEGHPGHSPFAGNVEPPVSNDEAFDPVEKDADDDEPLDLFDLSDGADRNEGGPAGAAFVAAATAAVPPRRGVLRLLRRDRTVSILEDGGVSARAPVDPSVLASIEAADGARATAAEDTVGDDDKIAAAVPYRRSPMRKLAMLVAAIVVLGVIGAGGVFAILGGRDGVMRYAGLVPEEAAGVPVAPADTGGLVTVADEAVEGDLPVKASPDEGVAAFDPSDFDLSDLRDAPAPLPGLEAIGGNGESEAARRLDDFANGIERAEAEGVDALLPRDDVPAVAVVEQAEFDLLKEQAAVLSAAVSRLSDAVGTRDDAMEVLRANLETAQARVAAAEEQAKRAEDLAISQNEILVTVVRFKEKLDMAEELIVDLSRRVALVEVADPADRVAVERSIEDINERVSGLARDVGLVARIATSGARPAATAPVAKPASVPGGDRLFSQTASTLQAPGTLPTVPADVRIGQFVEGYGEVIDIVPTADGARVVVMENGSVVMN